ncbi:hypothetical protein Salmi_Mp098 (mitochondrion) [Salvia miltiorrhiza]|uniref:Uncharacterized protein n=1 Tax=Salvia miltiorrhiza TaxID=226208 RepID=V9P506_SALMI|nr:hypothetical protein Salmi_Mp098 [Salvia miltiorrhiza]AGU16626.1 hypothetical protein Salmi_Mp098 [Salvia miltiorrhiza]
MLKVALELLCNVTAFPFFRVVEGFPVFRCSVILKRGKCGEFSSHSDPESGSTVPAKPEESIAKEIRPYLPSVEMRSPERGKAHPFSSKRIASFENPSGSLYRWGALKGP